MNQFLPFCLHIDFFYFWPLMVLSAFCLQAQCSSFQRLRSDMWSLCSHPALHISSWTWLKKGWILFPTQCSLDNLHRLMERTQISGLGEAHTHTKTQSLSHLWQLEAAGYICSGKPLDLSEHEMPLSVQGWDAVRESHGEVQAQCCKTGWAKQCSVLGSAGLCSTLSLTSFCLPLHQPFKRI